jgi:hypothetical protein
MTQAPKTEAEKLYVSALISIEYCKLLTQDLQSDIINRDDIPDDVKQKISELIRSTSNFHQSINELTALCQQ